MEKINRIKEVLVSRDMSQKTLAEKLGKNPNTIASIAQILDVDIRDLLISTKKS